MLESFFPVTTNTKVQWAVAIVIISRGPPSPESYLKGFSMVKRLRKAALEAGNNCGRHRYYSNLQLLLGSMPSDCPTALWTQEAVHQVPFRECFALSQWMRTVFWLEEAERQGGYITISASSSQSMLCIHWENAKRSLNGTQAERTNATMSKLIQCKNILQLCLEFFLRL